MMRSTFIVLLICHRFGAAVPSKLDPPQSYNAQNQQNKRDLLLGDLSYSYSATDIGSKHGSHIKTITVIKNVSAPKSDKTYQSHEIAKWPEHVKNHFKILEPDFGNIPPKDFFANDKRPTVIYHPKPKQPVTTTPTAPTKVVTEIQPATQPEEAISFEDQAQQDMERVLKIGKKPQNEADQPNRHRVVTKQEDRSKMDEDAKQAVLDDVECIQLSSRIQPAAAERSKQAQSKRFQEQSTNTDNRYASAIASVQQLSKQSPKSSPLVEDFSDFSLHNVRHMIDPVKANKIQSTVTRLDNTTASSRGLRSESLKLKSDNKTAKYEVDSYGSKIEPYENLDDRSAAYAISTQRPRKAYVAPLVQKSFITSSTTTQQPYLAPLKSRSPQTFYLIHDTTTTTQRPYLSPNIYKSYSVNKEQVELEMRKLQAVRDELERHQDAQEHQQLQETEQQSRQAIQHVDKSTHSSVGANEEPAAHASYQMVDVIASLPSQEKTIHKQPSKRRGHRPHNDVDHHLKHNIREFNESEAYAGQTSSVIPSISQSSQLHTNIHNVKKSNQPKVQLFKAVPLDISTQSPYESDSSAYKVPAHLVRHQHVFDSVPPHPFLESPFRPLSKNYDLRR